MSRSSSLQAARTAREQKRIQISIALDAGIPIPSASVVTHATTFAGEVDFDNGLQGSLTRLYNENPYLIAGSNITITSSANGPITISKIQSGGVNLSGNDGEVQFNNNGNLGSDPLFTYDSNTKSLTVPKIKGKLTYLSDGVTPFLNFAGTMQATTGVNGSVTLSRSDYSESGEETGPEPIWKSYTPKIFDNQQEVTLPNSASVAGRYIFANNTLKLLFTLTANNASGALAGTGAYRIALPLGYEIDTDHVQIGSPTDHTLGISLGTGVIHADAVGRGGAWTVLPVSTTQISLWGKDPGETSIVPFGSNGVSLVDGGNDLRVTFVATIPAIQLGSVSYDYSGPDIDLDGGTFTATKAFRLGTQYVEGVLSFGSGTQIFLYDSVFSRTGEYILFDYSLGSFPGGQAALNNNVTITAVDLKLSYLNPAGGALVLEDQPALKRIVLKLLSKPDNGKQWIEGNLVFAGPTQIILSDDLYNTSGTYDLFEVTGNITGLNHVSILHEFEMFTGTPFLDPANNKIVKVTLA